MDRNAATWPRLSPVVLQPTWADRSDGMARGLGRGEQLAQHKVQDTAVAEVVDLVESVDPAQQRGLRGRAVGAVNRAGEVHARADAVCETREVDRLGAVELEGLAVLAALEGQRQHAHAE